jgi:hypothetical protein
MHLLVRHLLIGMSRVKECLLLYTVYAARYPTVGFTQHIPPTKLLSVQPKNEALVKISNLISSLVSDLLFRVSWTITPAWTQLSSVIGREP